MVDSTAMKLNPTNPEYCFFLVYLNGWLQSRVLEADTKEDYVLIGNVDGPPTRKEGQVVIVDERIDRVVNAPACILGHNVTVG